MDNGNRQHAHARAEYLAALTVRGTMDEFGQTRWFVEDLHGDWIEGPFDSHDLAASHIANLRKVAAA